MMAAAQAEMAELMAAQKGMLAEKQAREDRIAWAKAQSQTSDALQAEVAASSVEQGEEERARTVADAKARAKESARLISAKAAQMAAQVTPHCPQLATRLLPGLLVGCAAKDALNSGLS
jgi:hypothetical protein